jgi:hypothetical protein
MRSKSKLVLKIIGKLFETICYKVNVMSLRSGYGRRYSMYMIGYGYI